MKESKAHPAGRGLLCCAFSLAALLPAAAASPAARYDYPAAQHGYTQLNREDPERTRLTDGRSGGDFHTVVYGPWTGAELPEFTVDWQFDVPVRITAVNVALAHPDRTVPPGRRAAALPPDPA